MADALIQNRIPKYEGISSDVLRNDILDRQIGVKDVNMRNEILKYVRLDPRVEVETIGGTYRSDIKDWTHYIKKKDNA